MMSDVVRSQLSQITVTVGRKRMELYYDLIVSGRIQACEFLLFLKNRQSVCNI